MPDTPLVLVVDDDMTARLSASQVLSRAGYRVEEAVDGRTALIRLREGVQPPVALVLLDLVMPQMDGKETLRRIRQLQHELPIIMLTGSTELDGAVELMRMGASDFITKPFQPQRLLLSVKQHLTIQGLAREVSRLRRVSGESVGLDDLIGAEGGLKASVALARRAAASDIPVLITGESGTGKEMLSRALHGASARSPQRFLAVNCGAIPENLVESTLFGHEKGSFTGAIRSEPGKFREADGGTLLLDEIAELSLPAQTRLLRVLQEREVEPVGSSRPVPINVRILSATHRNLANEVSQGRFREDLYYRLNALPIHIPPLRERRGDIAQLAEHLLKRFCAQERKAPRTLSGSAVNWLTAQGWSGNVRELENLLHRAVVLYDHSTLSAEDFAGLTTPSPLAAQAPGHFIALLDNAGQAKSWEQIEAEVIEATLTRCSGHVADAAKILGMGQSTLYKKRAAG